MTALFLSRISSDCLSPLFLDGRQVSIMKLLEHPNIVNLVEVIDDPNIDKFYMGMQSCSLFLYIFVLL
jgi:hypothetical protein